MHKKQKKLLLSAAALGIGAYLYKHKPMHAFLKKTAAMGLASAVAVTTPAYAQITESAIIAYAQDMQKAANARNIGHIARLLSDDIVVSLSRQGKGTATMDKSGYLDLLQKSWTQADNYRYTIEINNIVITGDTAKAQVLTTETWTKNNKSTKITTSSRATFAINEGRVLLLRSVSQVTVQ